MQNQNDNHLNIQNTSARYLTQAQLANADDHRLAPTDLEESTVAEDGIRKFSPFMHKLNDRLAYFPNGEDEGNNQDKVPEVPLSSIFLGGG